MRLDLAIERKRIALMAFVAALGFSTGPGHAEEDAVRKPCREDPNLVAPCFEVRGRLDYWNGTPSVRIWPVGTNRIIGVTEHRNTQGYATIPAELLDGLTTEQRLFANFVLCPYTVKRAGVMQLVCIESARNIAIRPSRP